MSEAKGTANAEALEGDALGLDHSDALPGGAFAYGAVSIKAVLASPAVVVMHQLVRPAVPVLCTSLNLRGALKSGRRVAAGLEYEVTGRQPPEFMP